jgi:hypothetical protein
MASSATGRTRLESSGTLGESIMRMLALVGLIAGSLFLLGVSSVSSAPQDKDKKYSIKDVMKKAMKGGLVAKESKGTATDEEAKTVLAMFKDLSAATPPKGDEESWKMKTKALVDAAQLYVDGKKSDAAAAFKGAANCMACHSSHKN